MSRRGAARSASGSSCRVHANSASNSPLLPESSRPSSGQSREEGGESDRHRQLQPAAASRFQLIQTPALGRPIVDLARRLLGAGLTSAEVCSLFTQTASVLARQEDGLRDGEWLALCAEFEGEDDVESDARVTAPGGSA